MKHTEAFELWTSPDRELSPAFRHMSYVLFRTDHEKAEVVGARCPDMIRLSMGADLFEALELSEEARRYLFEDDRDTVPLFVKTRLGVGVIMKRYDRHAGLGLYLHIHGRPQSLARLINSGALGTPDHGEMFRVSEALRAVSGEAGQSDMPSYEALADAWAVLSAHPSEGLVKTASDGLVYRTELESVMANIAAFVGCGLTFGDQSSFVSRVKCYRPLLLEILLLVLLTEVRTVSATRNAVCRITTLDGSEGGNVSLEIHYPLEMSLLPQDLSLRMDEVHRHLAWVCELGGLELQTGLDTPTRYEYQHGKLPEVCVTLAWLTNPAVLSTSDLKAKIRFLYEEEAERDGSDRFIRFSDQNVE